MLWEAGKTYDFDTLDNVAKTACNNVCTNKTWSTVDPKDAKILALHTEINQVKEELKKAKGSDQKGNKSGARDYTIEQWREEKGPDEIAKDNVTH